MIELPRKKRPLALAHHLDHAAAIASPERNVLVEGHVPADQRYPEVLDLGDPLEVLEQAEQHQDVEQREMVGDEYAGLALVDLVTAVESYRPGRVQPRIE